MVSWICDTICYVKDINALIIVSWIWEHPDLEIYWMCKRFPISAESFTCITFPKKDQIGFNKFAEISWITSCIVLNVDWSQVLFISKHCERHYRPRRWLLGFGLIGLVLHIRHNIYSWHIVHICIICKSCIFCILCIFSISLYSAYFVYFLFSANSAYFVYFVFFFCIFCIFCPLCLWQFF